MLDLFAGSGGLARAALEHGCAEVVLVEGHTRVGRQLSKEFTQVLVAVLPQGLQKLSGVFDLVVADPPYGEEGGPSTLAELGPWLHPRSLVVFEHHHKDGYVDDYGFVKLWRRRRFGETALSYYAGLEILDEL